MIIVEKTLKCDRCGREILLERYLEGTSQIRHPLKLLPDGWEKYERLDICPECSVEFTHFIDIKGVSL